MSGKHVALLVEDEAATADAIAKLLRSIDHDCIKAATIDDARKVLEIGEFCYIVADQQLIASPGDAPDVGVGQAFLRHARGQFPGKTGAGHHAVQILAISAQLRTPADGAKTMKYGASDFLEKPFTSDDFLRAIEEMISRAGRTAHRPCFDKSDSAREDEPAARPANEAKATLDVTGIIEEGKNLVRFSGDRLLIGNTSLYILLRLVEARLRDPNTWVPVTRLGGREKSGFNGVSRLDAELRAAGFNMKVHTNSPGAGWRLAPGIDVGEIDRKALKAHPEPSVKNMVEPLDGLLSRAAVSSGASAGAKRGTR